MSMCLFLVCTSRLNVGLMVADDDMRKVDKYIIRRSHNLWFEAKLILSCQNDAKKVYCYISPKVVFDGSYCYYFRMSVFITQKLN